MVPPLEESEEGERASFSRWEKRSVISNHFTELVLEITEMEMLPCTLTVSVFSATFCKSHKLHISYPGLFN